MANAATPEQVDEVRRLREQIAGYFVGDEPMGEAPPEQPAPGMPPAMPPDMPPEMASKQEEYMQAAQRNM